MSAVALPTRCTATPSQHALIKQLLAQAGYDRGTVTRKYRRIGAHDAWVDRPTDSWLASLSYQECQPAIAQLQKDAAHGAQIGRVHHHVYLATTPERSLGMYIGANGSLGLG